MSAETPRAANSLSLRLEELGRQVASARTAADEAVADAGRRAIGDVLDAVACIEEAKDQGAVLNALLEAGGRFASRTAFFLTRPGTVRGWGGHHFETPSLEVLQQLSFNYSEGSPWADFVGGQGVVRLEANDCERLANRFGAAPAKKAILIPFVLRGQLGGALYADELESDQVTMSESGLQLLTHSAARAIETLPFREVGSPTLRVNTAAASPSIPLWKPTAEDSTHLPTTAHETTAHETTAKPEIVDQPDVGRELDSPNLEVSMAEHVEQEYLEVPEIEPALPELDNDSVATFDSPHSPGEQLHVPALDEEESEPRHLDVSTPSFEAAKPEIDRIETAAVSTPVVEVPTFEVEDSAFEVEDSAFEVEDSAFEVEDSTFDAEDPAFEVKDSAFDTEDPAFDVGDPAFEVEDSAFGTEDPAFDVEDSAFDVEVSAFEVEDSAFLSSEGQTFEDQNADEAEAIPMPDEPTLEELSGDITPEPELEDTSTGIWSLEEEEEDDEPTAVGQVAVQIPAPSAPEPLTATAGPISAETAEIALGQQTVRLDIAALQGQMATAGASASGQAEPPSLAATSPPTPEPLMPRVDQEPQLPERAPELSPPLTVAPPPKLAGELPNLAAGVQAPPVPSTQGAGFATPSQDAYVPPPVAAPVVQHEAPRSFAPPPPVEDEPAAKAESGETSLVQPPADLEGPGLAFSSSPLRNSDAEDALHEEARRLARLLVSEIKLYNEEIIEEGRRNRDIYGRLKDDIDRSRQMYEERIDPRIRGQEDYFHHELVQRLAGGDASLLGI